MKYFGTSSQQKMLIHDDYLPMAKSYWGGLPLPPGAKIIGGYSDSYRAGALIALENGVNVCGNSGCISSINKLSS